MYDSDSDPSSDYDDHNEIFTSIDDEQKTGSSIVEIQILHTQQVFELMEEVTKQVCDVTRLTTCKARSLLNKFKWDQGKLLESIFDENCNLLEDKSRVVASKNDLECEICLETDDSLSKMFQFECNHCFCSNCFFTYVSSTIEDKGGLIENAIQCPGSNCSNELDDNVILDVLKERHFIIKYQRIITNNFVQNNRSIKWCPSPHCNNAICIEPGMKINESIKCSCGYRFCFHCLEKSHDPVTCAMIVHWGKMRKEDFEAINWILEHTKPCPSCKVNIEKNGGCMHMTCYKCRHEFCWVCMGKWAGHRCTMNNSTTVNASGILSRRFASYNMKYETMRQAYLLDVDRYGDKLSFEIELENQFIKVVFIESAAKTVLQCRRVLMHSYIFSYIMTTIDNQMFIFEENLIFLEQATEHLSGILEHEMFLVQNKQKVINASDLCKKRLFNLMQHVREGYEKNWWRKFPIPAAELLGTADVDAQL